MRKIAVIVTPLDAPQGVVFETSDVAVATVTQNGVVTPVGAGSATITAKSTYDSSISSDVAVTVS